MGSLTIQHQGTCILRYLFSVLQGIKCYPVLQCWSPCFFNVVKCFYVVSGVFLFLKTGIFLSSHTRRKEEGSQFFGKGNKRHEQTMLIQKVESSQDRLTVLALQSKNRQWPSDKQNSLLQRDEKWFRPTYFLTFEATSDHVLNKKITSLIRLLQQP